MVKKVTGVVIGPSGIGKIHIRELVNFGFKNIAIVGKRFKKNRINLLIKEYKNINFYYLNSLKKIKEIKPTIINVCSPTKYHYDHILIIKNFCKNLIVEKPIFWIKNRNISNLQIVKKLLFEKKHNIFVNLPMISLANQIKKKNKYNKIKKFDFKYYTKGKNQFKNIPIDLLPHALSFLFTLNSNELNKFKILRVNKKKNIWNCKIVVNDCLCNFFFRQDPQRLESRLSFKINQDTYLRKHFIKNNSYVNRVLKNKKKLIDLKNPMSDYLNLIYKNMNKKNILKKNNDITINSVKIMEKLINI